MADVTTQPDHEYTGHVAAQITVCQAGLGVAYVDHVDLVELRGAPDDLRDLAIALRGEPPCSSAAFDTAAGWWQSPSLHRALLLAHDDDARHAATVRATEHDVAASDVSARHAAVAVAGPRSASFVATLDWPHPLIVASLPDHAVLVFGREESQVARADVLSAGRHQGAAAVSLEAIRLYGAARRARAHRSNEGVALR